MNIKQFLESNQYKMWKEDKDTMSFSQKYQKRLDTLHKYKDVPLCECNNKLLINIDYWRFEINGITSESCSIYMIHENKNGDWCDLKIYSIPVDKMKENLVAYEDKIVKLWKGFAE